SIVAQNCKEDNYEKEFALEYDWIMIAGGDGTVEKVLLELRVIKGPIAILPFGNANNIEGGLDLTVYYKKIADQFEKKDFQLLSIGEYKTKEDKGWFVEGIGWGIFTALLLQIAREQKLQRNENSKVDFGIKNLIKLEAELPVHSYDIKLDKEDFSGEY